MTDFQRANRCLVAKDYKQAFRLFLRHATTIPADAGRAYAGAAECCLRCNVVETAVPVAPGIALVLQGDTRAAEYYFRLALQSNPKDAKALWGLCELLPESSGERRELLERSVAGRPGSLNLVALGDYYRSAAKNFERASALYMQAQEHSPQDQTAYLRLSDLCRRMGRPEEAKEWTRRGQEAYSRKRRVDGKG